MLDRFSASDLQLVAVSNIHMDSVTAKPDPAYGANEYKSVKLIMIYITFYIFYIADIDIDSISVAF